MYHKTLFKDALWIMPARDMDSALFRKDFTLTDKTQGRIVICGLGYFELFINGKKVGDDLFVPAYSDYEPRDTADFRYPIYDQMDHRIYALEYDVTEYLQIGNNTIGIMLGSGFYNQTKRTGEGHVSYGRIKLCFNMTTDEGSVISDASVRFKEGFIRSSNLFYGEEHDYRGFDYGWDTAACDKNNWEDVTISGIPESSFHIQDCPVDKVIRKIKPKLVKRFSGYSLYDTGENISGYPVVYSKAKNETITVECAENITDDLTLDFGSMGGSKGQKGTDTYITDGINEYYHPVFTWHGFRYFTATDNCEPVECRVIHADIGITSSFKCNDETLNWYYDAFIRSMLTNMHGGVPSDCPHRERLGYTGDGQLCCSSAMYTLDAMKFYRKWMEDIKEGQDMVTGHVQHTAPFNGGGGGPAGWGGAIVTVPYEYYMHYSDISVLVEFFPRMMKYFNYMESRCKNGFVASEEKGGWCLGDWCAPDQTVIPESYVNTCLYISYLDTAIKIAGILNKQTEIIKLEKLRKNASEAVINAYRSNTEHIFIGGIQGADAFAYLIGSGDDRTLKNIESRYTKLGTYDTGIFGTYILNKVLFENGHADLAYRLMTNKMSASFFNMKEHGATTLWERWNGDSNNHPMFGASVRYIFEHILGITQPYGCAGFDSVIIAPKIIEGLDHIKGHMTAALGIISVGYDKKSDSIDFSITIDKGIQAIFRLYDMEFKLNEGLNNFSISINKQQEV
ncbi:MAG: family 78 glycoside hydrolase catalytic domain [Clostridia bacterium]